MRRAFLQILMLLPMICFAAEETDFPVGETVLDTLPADIASANIHVRCSTGSRRGATWGLLFSNPGGDTKYRLTLTLPTANHTDEVYGGTALFTMTETSSTGERTISETTINGNCDTDGGANSIKLVYDGVSTRVYVGKAEQQFAGQLPFPCGSPLTLSLFTDRQLSASRITCQCAEAGDLGLCDLSEEEVIARARGSEDRMEGIWEYLDRSVDSKRAVLGGYYKFAVLANDNGGYDLIYLEGADMEPAHWSSGRIKARFTPTIFIGNYDMVWLGADRTLLDAETNAQLSDDSAILTLRFPLQNSQIRLRKVL